MPSPESRGGEGVLWLESVERKETPLFSGWKWDWEAGERERKLRSTVPSWDPGMVPFLVFLEPKR